MSTEQREKDLELLRVAAQLADGVAVLEKRVAEARLAWLEVEYARTKAIALHAPQHIIQARAAARSAAQLALQEREKYLAEAIQANAAHLREEALK